jgi:hypothetical protein
VNIWTHHDRAWVLPERECDTYIAAWPQLRTIVRVHPATIHAWSRGY